MIRLVAMQPDDFDDFQSRSIAAYAADKVTSGNWPEQGALERSRKEFGRGLPQGLATPGQCLFWLVDAAGERVGYLWYGARPAHPDTYFIFDFEVYEPFRRRGYATQALAALEGAARSAGVKRLELHVFGFNTSARSLYLKTGFVETNVMMEKKV